MSKEIKSPVKKFPGSVIVKSPLPYPDYIAWEKAVSGKEDEEVTQGENELSLWGGISAVVEEWNIKDFDLENPLATPRQPVLKLLTWLITEIGKIINEVEESPKE